MNNSSQILKMGRTLMLISRSIKKIPQDKQYIIYSRVSKVMQKHNINPQQFQNLNSQNNPEINLSEPQIASLLKDLEFNLNFIKLSYPSLSFNQQDMAKQQSLQQEKAKKAQQENKNAQKQSKQTIKGIQVQIQNEEDVMKQMKSMPKVRQQVQFSNWAEGNIDPQKLRKHKDLLQRQFFAGDHWKNKQKPRNSAQVMLQAFMSSPPIQPPKVTQQMLRKNDQNKFQGDPMQRFKKLKK